jgi:hypothetical protein
MTTRDAFLVLILSILAITGGFVWLFGAYGLIGGGVTLLLLSLFADKTDDDREEDGNG